jgi:hypothetical protein
MGKNMGQAANTVRQPLKPSTPSANTLSQLMSMTKAQPVRQPRPIQTTVKGRGVPQVFADRRSGISGAPSGSKLTTPTMSPEMRRIAMGNRNAV